MSRIRPVTITVFGLLVASAFAAAQESRQATGVKVGEVTQDSAIVWVRRTLRATRNTDGPVREGKVVSPSPTDEETPTLRGAAPGESGRVRVVYGTMDDLSDAIATDWIAVTSETDFSHQFHLRDLKHDTRYHFATETASVDGEVTDAPLRGTFKTAPPVDQSSRVLLTVLTCEAYKDRDRDDGFHIYDSILRLAPDFVVPNGDIVYLDTEDPRANSVPLARYHWQRMYALPTLIDLHLRVPGYWTKDDHDLYADDGWPSQRRPEMEPMTYEEGLRVNREQVPTGEKPYRTIRWGKHLQIWLVEGREFRSPNDMPDGPDKSIWGAEQKAWLEESLLASDADWKLLISPTPIVGPDRATKHDNLSNDVFTHEGNEVRDWIRDHFPKNLFLICGDRHWQFHSVDPETGVQEFSVGPASDQHAGGAPPEDQKIHRFYRVKGGFLSVEVKPIGQASTITFRLHDVMGNVVYQHQPEMP